MRNEMLSLLNDGFCFIVTFDDNGHSGSAEANRDAESDTFSLDISISDGFRKTFHFGSFDALWDKVSALPGVESAMVSDALAHEMASMVRSESGNAVPR